MAAPPSAPVRDDDPAHPNFDGIVFYATTDKNGIVATPATGQRKPPVTYLPLPVAVLTATELAAQVERIRGADAASYLADYLDDMLSDLTDAIESCRVEKPH
jgi:hypothetical protein